MKKKLLALGCIAALPVVLAVYGQTPAAQPQLSSPSEASVSTQRELVQDYCVLCHNQTVKSGELALDAVDIADVSRDPDVWEKVVRKMRAGMMPPKDMPRPDPATYRGFVTWLENELDRNAVLHAPAPGLHRLNRTEYANAIRDLLHLEIDPGRLLPSDDSSFGFDNMAGTLTLSSTLVEAYVSAAARISRLAIGEAVTPHLVTYRVPEDDTQNYHIEGLPFGTRGGILVDHVFPSDGEYNLYIIPIFGDNMSPNRFGSIENEQVEVLLDGERLELLDWEYSRGGQSTTDTRAMQVRFAATAGQHRIGVTFLATNFAPVLDIDRQFMRSTIQTGPTPGLTFFPHIGSIRVEGPFSAMTAQDSPSRRQIFTCTPASAAEETSCATQILTDLATRAFRAPVTAEDLAVLMDFYRMGRQDGSFDAGIQNGLARILAAPKFIYRIEAEPENVAAGELYRIGDLELASRLSYFLWSAAPDPELLTLATEGRLSEPAVLEQQVRRLLADPRSEALAVNFAGQWLNLRGVANVTPLPLIYPDFDDPLRQAMRREVELLFDNIVHEDRSIVDLLTADYTFLNERLAKHYGIPNVYGSQFRRVALGPEFDMRRGLLGKGAVLATTSLPDRTSPVKRGAWVLANILGVPAPDPPPNVPDLPETRNDGGRGAVRELTLREKMVDHRIRQDCIQCHALMDPIGFALENFDAIAMWRTTDQGSPIDASDAVYDGTTIDGSAGLREWLRGYSDQFAQLAVEKMLTYALGRGLDHRDMPLVRSIAREAAQQDNRFSALVMGVVNSHAFQMNAKVESD